MTHSARYSSVAFALACAGLLALAAAEAVAAEFPARPVRFLVASSPGGALDVLARLVGPKLTEKWAQPVVVDNRAGAGGVIGTEMVANANPDGYNILVIAQGFTANPFLYKKLPYRTPEDFAPITILAYGPNVLVVHPSVKAGSVKELIALAKAQPGKLNYATSGVGAASHLSIEMFKRMTGVDMVHIPYKGAGAATAAVVGGQVQLLFTSTGAAMPHIKSGRLKALGLTTAKRTPALPDVPTIAETGLAGFQVDGWYALMAPGKTPKPIIDRLYRDTAEVLKMPDTVARIESFGLEPAGISPQEFGDTIRAELKKWGKLIQEAGIKAE
ncbi:MAG: tripartite tricarboxylate transporter substrate binding protein [Betaproteobacteria bacterium]|nr:tripartite tricarboxylate transporter substrate binding protein [Betaproteobacteria bacterium]